MKKEKATKELDHYELKTYKKMWIFCSPYEEEDKHISKERRPRIEIRKVR